MSTCYISIMFVGTNVNTLGEIWLKFLQTILFLMSVWSPWVYLSEQFPSVIWSLAESELECFIVIWVKMTLHLVFVLQHHFRNYISPKSSSPSTISLRCLWCLSSSDLFCPFGGQGCIYLSCYTGHMSESNLHLPPADSSCASTCFLFFPLDGAVK